MLWNYLWPTLSAIACGFGLHWPMLASPVAIRMARVDMGGPFTSSRIHAHHPRDG
jgi:hypothetical protein